MNRSILVIVAGALGKMGREVVKAVSQASDISLYAAVDRKQVGEDIGAALGLGTFGIPISGSLQEVCVAAAQENQPVVMVDFTHPQVVYENVRTAIAYGVYPVVGTTGLTPEQIEELAEFVDKADMGAVIAPNFSIGMVLLQEAAIRASQYFDHVEIIELHHNQKADAPSGTAIQTAQRLAELGKTFNPPQVAESEHLKGARGARADAEIRIHSVRLPGLLAHQEVIFGAPGQIYTLRHDTSDRQCYMPGVLLAIRKVTQLKRLIYGLEKLL
ncbi:MAG: 4-hydroxy-tetrahydrodipicolinate reductase [Thermosynechococcus sp.]|uniref:4-hydroxy-tetrahydrodipicolinate reductase n=1 Tax=Thermosynechococcus sp. TaxID=2814275 RepID=UPI00391A9B37